MKIILTYISGISNRDDPYITLLPTGLTYLHACLCEAGYDSTLINFSGWSAARIERTLMSVEPDVVGISQWTHNRHSSLELASTCRRLFPSSTIIMGGAHATFCYEELLNKKSPLDCIVIGEAEITLLEVIECVRCKKGLNEIAGLALPVAGKVFLTQKRALLDDLDKLPLPARYLKHSVGIDMELQSEFIVTSRGCPSNCFFCSSPAFWEKKVRFRSPSSIIEEILYIREHFGKIYFSIRDDTFTADRARVVEFCQKLIDLKVNILWNCQSRVSAIDEDTLILMKRAGCECIQLGVESGSIRILRQLGKSITPAQIERACGIIKEVGINLSVYLISDIPGETPEDLRQTIDIVRRIHPDDGYVSPLAYYPGTKLFTDAVAAGVSKKSLFVENSESALYAAAKTMNSTDRLITELSNARRGNRLSFKRQKEHIGYCYTTNILAAEYYRQNGNYRAAENELKEIVQYQEDNPWGWFLLGDLYSETRNTAQSTVCYRRVLELVPMHLPSIKSLSPQKKRGHRYDPAKI